MLKSALVAAGAATGLLGGSATLSGCAGAANATGATTTVQFWHLFSGGDGGVFQSMLAKAQKAVPNTTITPVVLTWGGPYYTKLAMASVGGRPPDVAVMHITRVIGYAPGGLLDPWDEKELAQQGISSDTMSPLLWERGVVDGKRYAVPIDFHAFVLAYNTDICAKAGVLDGDGRITGVDTWEGLAATAKKIAAVTKGVGLSYGYVGDGAQVSRLFWGLYGQTGAPVDFTPGKPAVFDTEVATTIVSEVAKLLDGTVAAANVDYAAAVAAFSSGRSGMIFTGNWEVPAFLKAGLKIDAIPFPPLMGKPGTFGDSHALVLPRQANLDPARRAATYKIVGELMKNSLEWTDGGHIPAYTPVIESAEYAAKVPQSHYAGATDHAIFEPSAWFTGSGSEFQAQISLALNDAWLNKASPQAAVDDLARRINAALQTTPPA